MTVHHVTACFAAAGSWQQSPAAHNVPDSRSHTLRLVKEGQAGMGVVSDGGWPHVEHQSGGGSGHVAGWWPHPK